MYKENQLLITGVITQGDVIRAYMREIGRRGGMKVTPRKRASSSANMAAINARKKAKKEAMKGVGHE